MRRRLHGRHLRPPSEEIRRHVVRGEGMRRSRDRRDQRREEAGPGLPVRPAGGRRQLVRIPRIHQNARHREPQAVRHRRPSGDAGGDREMVPGIEEAALPRPRPKEHIPSDEDEGQEGDNGRFQSRLHKRIEEGMRRGVRGVRFEVVEAVSEAGFVAFGKGRFHVSLLRIPEGDVEIDLHVQRGGIAQRHGEEKDEGEDPIQFGGFRADRLGEGLRGLQPQCEAG